MSIKSPTINSNSSNKFPSFADKPPVREQPQYVMKESPVTELPPLPPFIQAPPVIIENIPDVAPDYCKINNPDINNGQDTYLGVSSNKYLDGSLINDNNTMLRIYTEKDCELLKGKRDENNGAGYKGECIILNKKGEPNGSYTNMCGKAPPNNGAQSPEFECPLGYSKQTDNSPYTIDLSNNIRLVDPNQYNSGNYVCMANPTEKPNTVKYNFYAEKQDNTGRIILNEQNSDNSTIFNSFVCPIFDNNDNFRYWTKPEISMFDNKLVCTTTLSQNDVGRSKFKNKGIPTDNDEINLKKLEY
jgi:hypothetical protein